MFRITGVLPRPKFLIQDKLDVCHFWPTWTYMKQPQNSTTRQCTRHSPQPHDKPYHSNRSLQRGLHQLFHQLLPVTSAHFSFNERTKLAAKDCNATTNLIDNFFHFDFNHPYPSLFTFFEVSPHRSRHNQILSFAQNVTLQPSSSSNARWWWTSSSSHSQWQPLCSILQSMEKTPHQRTLTLSCKPRLIQPQNKMSFHNQFFSMIFCSLTSNMVCLAKIVREHDALTIFRLDDEFLFFLRQTEQNRGTWTNETGGKRFQRNKKFN